MNGAKSGFTLIEMLVASLLLGMLVTILTMVFNSSAIAWRTGKASVSKMSLARRQLTWYQHMADNILPRVDEKSSSRNGRVLGAWRQDGTRETRRNRALEVQTAWAPLSLPNWASNPSAGSSTPEPWTQVSSIQSLQNASGQGYTVGVWSYGPDGKEYTDDDITTWPQEVE